MDSRLCSINRNRKCSLLSKCSVLELVVLGKSICSSKVMITFVQMSIYSKQNTSGEKYTHISVFCCLLNAVSCGVGTLQISIVIIITDSFSLHLAVCALWILIMILSYIQPFPPLASEQPGATIIQCDIFISICCKLTCYKRCHKHTQR